MTIEEYFYIDTGERAQDVARRLIATPAPRGTVWYCACGAPMDVCCCEKGVAYRATLAAPVFLQNTPVQTIEPVEETQVIEPPPSGWRDRPPLL